MSQANRSFVTIHTTGVCLWGFYHGLRQDLHSDIEADLADLQQWGAALAAQGISIGTYLSVEGEGKGPCYMVTKRLGPFLTG